VAYLRAGQLNLFFPFKIENLVQLMVELVRISCDKRNGNNLYLHGYENAT